MRLKTWSTRSGRYQGRRLDGTARWITALAVFAALATLSVTAFAVSQSAEEEHQQTLFRGGGSDTTYEMMVALDTLYNASPGCDTVDTRVKTNQSGTHLHNNTCQLEDINEANTLSDPAARLGHPPAGFAADTNPLQTTRRANYDHDVIAEYFPLGSSFGIRQLQRQDSVAAGTFKCGQNTNTAVNEGPPNTAVAKDCPVVDFARSSRVATGPEITSGLRAYGYAREALTWACVPSATAGCSLGTMSGPDGVPNTADDVRDLTTDQISHIMKCDEGFRFWDEVNPGAPHTPIRVYSAQAGSGTRGVWDGFVNGGTLANDGRASGPLTNTTFNGVPGICAKATFENSALPKNGAGGIDPQEYDGAFFYFSSARHSKPASAGPTKLGLVNGFDVSQDTVNGEVVSNVEQLPLHPYARTVFNVIRFNDPDSINAGTELKEYLSETGFLCKDNNLQQAGMGNTIRLTMEKEGFFRPPFARANQTLLPGVNSFCRVNVSFNNTL